MNQAMFFLYGPPGSGKTTIGKLLADILNFPFFDLDEEIKNRWGCTISQIFSNHGEAAFRQAEVQEIKKLLAKGEAVIALGGGSLVDLTVRTLVQNRGTVLCLHATPSTLLERLAGDTNHGNQKYPRPLLAGDIAQKLAGLLSQRAEHYASFPLQLNTTHLDPQQAAWESQILFRRFRIGKANLPYDVCIQGGGLDSIGKMLVQRELRGPVALVTDSNTGPLYAERVMTALETQGIAVTKIVIPAGEVNKNIESVQALWYGFLDARLERGSTVLALGGGVVGDLSGFAASTYMRGITWINVPTTLLAMVDASLGGKTGVDLPCGKNLVGAFYPPAFVLVDPNVLLTLPEVEIRTGMAEVIKHGIIGDPGLLEMCAGFRGEGELDKLITRAMAVKIRIIETDPYDKGERATLNLGHTVGHALELVSGYRLRHGEAVAIGMVVETRLAERLGLAEQGLSLHIASILAGINLPVDIPADLDRAAIRRAMEVDKKKSQGRICFSLPASLSRVLIGVDVPDDLLDAEI